jgi:hypothetical protein
MKRVVIVRGALIALIGLCKLLTGCKDCEGPEPSDRLSPYSEVVPKGTPAIRCRVVTRCEDAYALNGKYSDTLPSQFKIRDRGNGIANQQACARRWRDGSPPPFLECVDVFDFVPICADQAAATAPL